MPGYLEKQEGVSPPYSLAMYTSHQDINTATSDYNNRMTSSTIFSHDAAQNGVHRDYAAHGNVTFNSAVTQNYEYPMNTMATGSGGVLGTSGPELRQTQRKPPKRKRIISFDQRKAANVRERRRMLNLNESFDLLRNSLPTFSYEKKLSRIETLRLALIYIAFMTDILNGANPKEVKLFSGRLPSYGVKKNGRMARGMSENSHRDAEFLSTQVT